mmetsp:Transcript_85643/g.239234  ORF Transcript_85643/g.239234 Transcript_85643/m.239234 type:complete len:228 (-) Transcript_85643:548-1231(-)
MRGLIVSGELGVCEGLPHLCMRKQAWLGSASQSQAPLADDDGVVPEFPRVFLHRAQMLGKRSPVPFILEAMVPVNFKANVSIARVATSREARGLAGGRAPMPNELRHGTLENRQHDGDHVGVHAGGPYRLHSPAVKATQGTLRHLRRWLVAHGDTCHRWALAVAPRDDVQGPEGLREAPLAPVPPTQRPLTAPAGSFWAFTSWSTMKVKQNLQAEFFRPVHRTVQVL